MRNISFSLTTPQFLDKSKDVTRRQGWKNLKPGDVLMACEKCQGIKKGERIVKLGKIIVMGVSREPLHRMTADALYGREEVIREGFPKMSAGEFVDMFCKHNQCGPSEIITRIVFCHLNVKTMP